MPIEAAERMIESGKAMFGVMGDDAPSASAPDDQTVLSARGSDGDTDGIINVVRPVYIEDVAAFKAGLIASHNTRPVRALREFEEIEPKL